METEADAGPAIRIERGSENPEIDLILASAWQACRSGDFAAAEQRYREVLRGDPYNRDALLGMAAVAQQRAQDDVAARYYDEVLALDPQDSYAIAGMASLPGMAGMPDAEDRLRHLLAHHPQSAVLHFTLGNRYAEQSRWSDAQHAYSSASELDPGNARFAFNLAVSLDHLGREELAAYHYRHALQLDSDASAGFDHALTHSRLAELAIP